MDSNFSFLIIICLLTASWYYYTKYKDLERDFIDLNNNLSKVNMENSNYRVRIKDLQKYKNDVSKTFKILDNELVQINNHVEKNNQQSQLSQQLLSQSLPVQLTSNSNLSNTSNSSSRVNLLTPDMLNNLIENMNQEFSFFSPLLNTNESSSNATTHDPNSVQVNNEIVSSDPDSVRACARHEQHQDHQGEENENNILNTESEINNKVNNDSVRAEHVENESEHSHNAGSVQELPRILSMMNNDNTEQSTMLRSMSFPNLPNMYGRLRIPISNFLNNHQQNADHVLYRSEQSRDVMITDLNMSESEHNNGHISSHSLVENTSGHDGN